MEAGIADPSPTRSKASKPRTKHVTGGHGNAAGTGASVVGVAGRRGGGGGRGGGRSSKAFNGPSAAPEPERKCSPVDGRARYAPVHGSGIRDARAREPVASADGGGGGGQPHQGASHRGGSPGWSERHKSGVASAATGVVPRRPVSPLILPMLTWPSPAMAAVAAAVGGGSLDGEHGRGRSSSPFGLLPGPPTLVGNKPRRGGTREPPVEAGSGGGHFRGPPGPPPSKRYRMVSEWIGLLL